ncbi:putative F-box/LRR-repeat protein 23 isoform X2 [Vitis vinifera]|nr:putative F-box/LRR-repeat protein 23 isoform X2 [Vitis vinifera]XP_059590806.1 putative F-box/LRR-repeat protein 23 isoform X2 [Vitis vinifera]XP_059590807.1 putative F-box/LRR-repeat protein 23 isoform X2 [Vitis vinifera]XP_059590808.1 putative F-box/LRR-repeat protein 23 isoform X2 [Vitis vinifera]
MEERKWEALNMDILVNVFGRVGMESLLLDVPFVCKPWYKASREPQCWEDLIFPEYIKPDDIWGEDSPDRGFSERLVTTYQENLSVTAFMRFIVNRSCGCATIIKLPKDCTEEALEYIANECPRLKALDVVFNNFSMEDIIPKLSKWKSLELMRLGKFHVGLFHMKSVLPQIGLHCNNFIWLSAPHASIEKDEASAIVASLPRLKYLDLHYSFFEKEALVMILQGCKKLVHLDVRKCFGFCDDDAEILELASHIPVFMCEGSGIIPEIGTSYLRDRRLDHELYCDQINHDDCVYDLFDYDDLFDGL